MATSDGKWRVDVGNVGATRWYRLVGDGYERNFPSITALMEGAMRAGVDVGDLREQPRGTVGS